MNLIASLDNALQRHLGLPYLKVTRDDAAHDRCLYLIHVVRKYLPSGPTRCLDIGCGGGLALIYILREFPDAKKYLGLDLKAERLAKRYRHVSLEAQFQNVDLDTDWKQEPSDLVWSGECLEHLIDDAGLFRKMVRATKPGGLVVVTMPSLAHRIAYGREFPGRLKVSPTQDGHHVRLGYDPRSLRRLAEGTSASLVQADAVTFADSRYLARQYGTKKMLKPVIYWYHSMKKTKETRFMENPKESDDIYRQFQSISGVYRVS